ncbi:MAG: MOSC domain-containing protein [Phycisphaerales bacterium]
MNALPTKPAGVHEQAIVASIQVGRVAPLGPDRVPSGFVKNTVEGPVEVRPLGLAGDEQADLTVHGGLEKAVYFYPEEHYAQWLHDVPNHADRLNHGGFGENITSRGLTEQTVAIGDVFVVGTSLMQVTQPRQPCFKLGLRFEDNSLGRLMIRTGRTGWYVRVIQNGSIQQGDSITLTRRPNPDWTIARFNEFIVNRSASRAELEQLAGLEGLASNWREALMESL